MLELLLGELDSLGVSVGHDDGRPFLRGLGELPARRRAELLARITANRDGVIAHFTLKRTTPPPAWECVVCDREVTAELIPLLAGPHYCANGDGSVTKVVRDADGITRVPVPQCPFKNRS